MNLGNKAIVVLISLLVTSAVFLLTFIITYHLACLISPPYIEEANGERHPVMVIGQVFVGLLVATTTGVFSLYMSYKKVKQKQE